MLFPFQDVNPTRRFPVVTVVLIVINVLALLWLHGLDPAQLEVTYYQLGFVPARLTQQLTGRQIPVDPRIVPSAFLAVIDRGLVSVPVLRPTSLTHTLLTLITCMFLHGGWIHLIGNMWFLWIFGNNVEDRLGPLRFLLFYLAGGIFASLCHYIVSPLSSVPVVGASGAVSTMLGAYVVTWPYARIRTLVVFFYYITIAEIPAIIFLGIWFMFQVFEGLASPSADAVGGVAWWAHIGGFLAGMIAMPVISPQEDNEDEQQVEEDEIWSL